MGHAGVNQNSFRTPSELIQKAFRVIQDSLSTHSEFVQNLVRSHSGVIQNSQNAFRTNSELILNPFRTHSENIQESFKSHSWVIQVSSRCPSAFNWDSFRTSKTNGPSENSHDEFMGLRIHLGRPRLTNSSGYEFIDWDLAGRIHQGRNLAWWIRGATNSYSETWQNKFIKWEF